MPAAHEQQTFTMKQVMELLAVQSAESQKNLMEFVKELKKPSETEQAKLDADERKLKKQQEHRLAVQTAEVVKKEQLKKYCPHGTTHPGTHVFSHAWRAQVNSNGYWVPTCQQCLTQLKPIKATQYEFQNGVNLNLYSNLDVAALDRMAANREKPVAV